MTFNGKHRLSESDSNDALLPPDKSNQPSLNLVEINSYNKSASDGYYKWTSKDRKTKREQADNSEFNFGSINVRLLETFGVVVST